ncbi:MULTISPECIES: helix-turn-helix domain-containing protein [Lactococcus]|nr:MULTISPECIES: helix-turn-helix domain-containing protein [Lactococcus]NHI71735.1 helix-turn-helix domain-containing protein [Lactococcus petauri]
MNKISNTQQRLKEIMSERGLKQVDIMKMSETYKKELDIKMPKNYLSQYVNGKSTPDNLRLVLLSKVLGVSEAWLMGYDVPRNDEEEESPLIEKTVDNMKKLTEERQENVLKFSKMQLDEQSEAIEKQKVITINNKKPSDVDADGIDWDEWVAFDGRPMSEHDKQVIKEHLGDELKD